MWPSETLKMVAVKEDKFNSLQIVMASVSWHLKCIKRIACGTTATEIIAMA